jgi:hypothetical protein
LPKSSLLFLYFVLFFERRRHRRRVEEAESDVVAGGPHFICGLEPAGVLSSLYHIIKQILEKKPDKDSSIIHS